MAFDIADRLLEVVKRFDGRGLFRIELRLAIVDLLFDASREQHRLIGHADAIANLDRQIELIAQILIGDVFQQSRLALDRKRLGFGLAVDRHPHLIAFRAAPAVLASWPPT